MSPHNADTKSSRQYRRIRKDLWCFFNGRLYTEFTLDVGVSSFEWRSAMSGGCENISTKKYEKPYYETSLDDAIRYTYMGSFIHWRATVLSEKSVRIVR